MENNSYIAAIDFGSSNITVAVASKDPDGRLNVIDLVSKPMQGMSYGEVTNIEQVTTAVRSVISDLETDLNIKVTKAYAGISGHDIKCADSSYFVYISGEDHEILKEDVIKLHASMANMQPPEGIVILDRTPQKYVIDSYKNTMEPVGCFGHQLEATFNFILANRSSLDRLNKAFLRLNIKPEHIYTNAQASAEAVLSDDERESGVAVVDIGSNCTDICIWQDNIMRYVAMLPIGADAINKDIRLSAIPVRYIEKLKTKYGYAMANNIPEEKKHQSIKIPGPKIQQSKEISFYNLAQIIEARMLDIIDNVVEEIRESGYADKLGSGIVLTGGGALLNDVDTLFHERTKLDVRIGSANPERLNEESMGYAEDPQMSSIIGLLLLGVSDSQLSGTTVTLRKQPDVPESQNPQDQSRSEQETETADTNTSADQNPAQTADQPATQSPAQPQKPQTPQQEKQPQTTEKKEEAKKPATDGGKKQKNGGLIGGLKKLFNDIFDVVDDDDI